MPFIKEYYDALEDKDFIEELTKHFTEEEKNTLCDIESRHSIKLVELHNNYKNDKKLFVIYINIFKKEFKTTNLEEDYIFDHYCCQNSSVYKYDSDETDETNSY